jgi:hypothetical protein
MFVAATQPIRRTRTSCRHFEIKLDMQLCNATPPHLEPMPMICAFAAMSGGRGDVAQGVPFEIFRKRQMTSCGRSTRRPRWVLVEVMSERACHHGLAGVGLGGGVVLLSCDQSPASTLESSTVACAAGTDEYAHRPSALQLLSWPRRFSTGVIALVLVLVLCVVLVQ